MLIRRLAKGGKLSPFAISRTNKVYVLRLFILQKMASQLSEYVVIIP